MTITINLEPEKEDRLRKRAAQRGQDLDSYVQSVIEREASLETLREQQDEAPRPGESLAEFLQGYIGVVSGDGSMSARDSEKVFGEILEEKRRARNL